VTPGWRRAAMRSPDQSPGNTDIASTAPVRTDRCDAVSRFARLLVKPRCQLLGLLRERAPEAHEAGSLYFFFTPVLRMFELELVEPYDELSSKPLRLALQ
jgi:hypothetical protein